jgi:hypothetical protein
MSKAKNFLTFFAILLIIGLNFISVLSGEESCVSDFNQKEHWVIIVSGGGEDDPGKMAAGPGPAQNTSLHAYNTFKSLGYDDEHILYLHDRNTSIPGVDGLSNKSMLEYAIKGWLSEKADFNDECCIYIIAHGRFRSIKYNLKASFTVWNESSEEKERVFDDEFAEWIDTVQPDILTVVLDSCFSGSFIRALSKNNRIIITCTSQFTPSIAIDETVFSFYFLNKLVENVTYAEAWEYADHQLFGLNETEKTLPILDKLSILSGKLIMSPQIDDNGDGIGHGRAFFKDKLPIKNDGLLAKSTYP